MNRIDESLKNVFRQNRLVIWYDPEGQWINEYEAFDESGIKKIKVEDNEFGTKVAIHRDPDTQARYLLYFPTARPKDADNWLLDVLLQSHEYKADRASLALQDVGLPYEFRPLVEEHISFFGSAKRIKALRELLAEDEDDSSIRLKMMAVVLNTAPDVDSLLLEFLCMSSTEKVFDSVEELFSSANLVESFWRKVSLAFGYASAEPSLRDFAVTLFRWDNPLDSGITLNAHARVFLQQWKDSQKCGPSYRELAETLEADLHIEEQLNSLSDIDVIEKSDTFPLFEKFMIHKLCRDFEAGENEANILSRLQARRASFWFAEHADGYEALIQAITIRESITSAELKVESIDDGLARYLSSWHRIDTAYRKFCFYQRSYGQRSVLGEVIDWVEKTYENNFLLPLANCWSDQIRRMEKWECAALPSQMGFFNKFVQPFISKKQKIIVIVSDALRYEAASEFIGMLRAENRWQADLEASFAVLPSYTQLGIASLLPGKDRSIQMSDSSVNVDGISSSGIEGRKKILSAALGAKATAVQYEAFIEMNTKTEARALVREHDVVYIFHNAIDAVGDKPGTEAKTAESAETAFSELLGILRKVANANASNILLTSDHGFLFQQSEVQKADDLPLPEAKQWLNKNRRFALGKGISSDPAVKIFSAAELGLEGDWHAAFPLSLGRFPLSGSGKRNLSRGDL